MLGKIIDKIQVKYWTWQYKRDITDYENTYKFIWGIISYDDLTSNEANLHTMNDIDIIYDKKRQIYILGVETMFFFKNGIEGERKYIRNLFDKLTEWMVTQGYDVNQEMRLCDVFLNRNTLEFLSLEELYVYFKLLVKGF